ncbi:hypothetical protein [Acinetobacter gerneri]|uniref:hypothetical protein n=1 Tax=Acinetobacter gerneri TaxID=202952 RepID=UPI003A8AED36
MLKVRFNVVAIFLYLFPALLYLYLTNLSKVNFYDESLFAIKVSVFFTVGGFLLGLMLSRKLTFKLINYSSNFYLLSAKFLILIAILSISIQLLKFGIPVFNNSIREYILNGIFWNIFTFSSMVGLFFSSYLYFSQNIKFDKFFKFLLFLLFFLTFLTGWKSVLINCILIFFSFFILYKNIKITLLMKIFFTFLVIFFGINALRSGNYTVSFLELFNYLFYGFENFSRIAPSYSSNCLHSIPLFNCQFSYDNAQLINPTFNVYTALMPIYADGKSLLVGLVFFSCAFLLGLIRDYKNSFFIFFLFYLLHYFFMMAHNGYVFNSGSFFIVLVLLLILDLTRVR